MQVGVTVFSLRLTGDYIFKEYAALQSDGMGHGAAWRGCKGAWEQSTGPGRTGREGKQHFDFH